MITIISAGMKNGDLPMTDHVVDCRSMPNPYHDPALAIILAGLDALIAKEKTDG